MRSLWVQDQAVQGVLGQPFRYRADMTCFSPSSPATHDVTVTAEHLGETADDDVGRRQGLDINEAGDGLIDDNEEAKLVCQFAQLIQRRGAEERVRRKLAEQRKYRRVRGFECASQGRQVGREAEAEEVTSRSPLLEDFQGVGVREADDDGRGSTLTRQIRGGEATIERRDSPEANALANFAPGAPPRMHRQLMGVENSVHAAGVKPDVVLGQT